VKATPGIAAESQPDVTHRKPPFALLLISISLLVSACNGCGGTKSNASTPPPGQTPPPTGQPSNPPLRVFFVIMENQRYEDMVGSANMPYLNSLIPQGAIADNYFANTHPSIGNYFMLTTGQIITNDNSFSGPVEDDNLVRRLTAANKTWKVYAESLPSVGYLGGNTGAYVKRHNPFAYFSDVVNDPAQAPNIVPYQQLASDLVTGNLPDFVYILPNQQHNMHDCPGLLSCTYTDRIRAGDDWLQANLPAILNSSALHSNAVLVFTMDESRDDSQHGGGHIVTLFIGPKAKVGFRSSNFYQHESLLRYILDRFAIGTRPGASANAASMDEFVR
jgi:phosphatidylinositol-3-phosphatase